MLKFFRVRSMARVIHEMCSYAPLPSTDDLPSTALAV